jgi:hypothetical protein
MHDPISDYPPAMSPVSEPPVARLGLDEFISEEQLARLLERGDAIRNGCILRGKNGALYTLQEAVRVLGNVSQETDPFGFIGIIDTVGSMLKRGFVMNSERIALGRAIYDAEYGYLVQPVGNGSADQSGVNPKLG